MRLTHGQRLPRFAQEDSIYTYACNRYRIAPAHLAYRITALTLKRQAVFRRDAAANAAEA